MSARRFHKTLGFAIFERVGDSVKSEHVWVVCNLRFLFRRISRSRLPTFPRQGEMFYDRNSRGTYGAGSIHLRMDVSMLPPLGEFKIADQVNGARRSLVNAHFTFQRRESRGDLAARVDWEADWEDQLTGTLNFIPPALSTVPTMLRVAARVSWRPVFVCIEWQLGAARCSITMGPTRGISAWSRPIYPTSPRPFDSDGSHSTMYKIRSGIMLLISLVGAPIYVTESRDCQWDTSLNLGTTDALP